MQLSQKNNSKNKWKSWSFLAKKGKEDFLRGEEINSLSEIPRAIFVEIMKDADLRVFLSEKNLSLSSEDLDLLIEFLKENEIGIISLRNFMLKMPEDLRKDFVVKLSLLKAPNFQTALFLFERECLKTRKKKQEDGS